MAENMEGVKPEAEENVSGTAVEEMYADPSDNDEVDQDETEAEAEEQDFTDDEEEDGGAGADGEAEDGKMTKLRLVPVMGKMDGNKSEIGLPRLIAPDKVVDYLGKMSEPYGVTLTAADDGLIDVKW